MSQNDLTIANQGFASFRSDLNSALQALGSTNSGTSAPSTTFANQLFYDTTNNILKIRNEDNDAFISLFTLDQSNDNIESLTINGALSAESLDLNGGELILDADNDTSITADTDDQIDFKVGGTDTVKVTGTQTDIKVSASRELNILKDSGDDALVLQSSAPDASNNLRQIELAGNIATFSTGASSGTSATERMRIDSSGLVLIGHTSTSTSENVIVLNSDAGSTGHNIQLNRGSTDTKNQIAFSNPNGQVGTIQTSGSSTSYNTSSDYRLKENVVTDWDATTRLKQLKPSRFNFKSNKDITVDGFLAHEVSGIIPEAITGEKDETQDLGTIKDKDGNVISENVLETQTKKDDGQTWTKTKTENVYQGIDQSKLVPLLVKTIQELEARIATLESK